ncbi:hypothetical protein [Lederbergia graminis]|uniref:Uncharacterized protein n=1 Tax=Lederbergia graminis TaxID=735518 RepID=A0ABW0LH94_9BACI
MKKSTLISFGVVVLCLLTVIWLYPHSMFGENKTFAYNADDVIVEEFMEDLHNFKEINNIGSTRDLASHRLQYVLPVYEQEWLTSKDAVKIKASDLEEMLKEVKSARNTMLELAFEENYSKYAKDFLKMNIKSWLTIEDMIVELTSSQHSKKEKEILYHNLHVEFINNFRISLQSFYEEAQEI